MTDNGQVTRLEAEIDAMNKRDSNRCAASSCPAGRSWPPTLHLCRTVSRRAERLSVELATMEHVNPAAVKYLNRLSDWFFVAARVSNDGGANDVLWQPGANR